MAADPNFLYIGTSKAGSTWIFKTLSWHPEIYMYPGKDLGFFTSDWDKGWDWYRANFDPEPHHKVIGEVSHSYMVSEDATRRLHERLPDAKLMVCLREPVDRTFSQYLDGIKNGKISGSLEEELERTASLINRSSYGTHIARYLEVFPREQLHIAAFDDLKSAPAQFASDMFRFLEVEDLPLPETNRQKVLPAGEPRVRSVAMAAKVASKAMNKVGLAGLRGKLKTSPAVRNVIYRPFTSETRPTIPSDIEARLRDQMRTEVLQLDEVAGTDFATKWGYR